MFTDEERDELAGLIGAVPRAVIADAVAHLSDAAPAGPEAAALARVDGAAEALRDYQNQRPWAALGWARRFALRFAKEIRGTLCGEKAGADAQAVGLTATGVSTALAGWLTGLVGLTGPVALGVAALLVLAMGRAVVGSICELTDEALAEALGAKGA